MFLTTMAKWWKLIFPLYSVEFLNLSDDNNSHQSFPWAPLKAARFTEKHNGLLRHFNVQSNASNTATVPTRGTFRWWNSFLLNLYCRKTLWGQGISSRYNKLDSITRNKVRKFHKKKFTSWNNIDLRINTIVWEPAKS